MHANGGKHHAGITRRDLKALLEGRAVHPGGDDPFDPGLMRAFHHRVEVAREIGIIEMGMGIDHRSI